MSGQTKVGIVPMLDISGSMTNALSVVKIDSKAFVRSARPNDQFAVVTFDTTAKTIYPNTNELAVVSQNLIQTKEAANVIQSLNTSGITNMGQAIQKATALLNTSTADVNAFVMLSDGWANTGPDPASVLPNSPPLFIAGLGSTLDPKKFDKLIAKNPNSEFHSRPNAYQMMQLFNHIRGIAPDAGVTANALNAYRGADYTLTNSTIAGDTDEVQINVVWSDPRLKYTKGSPSPTAVNVVLINPAGKATNMEPQITGDGYCIFNVSNPQPGTWKTLVQYDVSNTTTWGTTAGFEFDTEVNLLVSAEKTIKAGAPLKYTARITDEKSPVENLKVSAHILKPSISTYNALKRYSKDINNITPDTQYLEAGMPENIAKLNTYRDLQLPSKDILANKNEYAELTENKENAVHHGEICDTQQAGSYSIQINVKGTNPKTGKSFSRTKLLGTLVMDNN